MRAPFSCGHIYVHLLVWSVLADTSKRDPVPQKTTTPFWWLFCKLLQTVRPKNKSRNPQCRATFRMIQTHQMRFATEKCYFRMDKQWSLVFSCKIIFWAFLSDLPIQEGVHFLKNSMLANRHIRLQNFFRHGVFEHFFSDIFHKSFFWSYIPVFKPPFFKAKTLLGAQVCSTWKTFIFEKTS